MSGIPTITPLDAIVGKNVQKLRKLKGVSQEQLAEVLDCSDGFVSLLETGKRAWSNKWIWDVCQFFNVEAAVLFGGVVIAPEDRPLYEAIKERMDIFKEEAALKGSRAKPSNKKS